MMQDLTLDELIAGHAAGNLPEPISLAVATHLALSASHRREFRTFEAAGGAMLEKLEPVSMREGCLSRLLDALDDDDVEDLCAYSGRDPRLPAPLAAYVPGRLEELRWRSYGTASEAELPLRSPGFRTALIRVKAGRSVPQHTHDGHELTVVLDGGFTDASGHYVRGDLVLADHAVDHRPVADDDQDCLCLAVTDAPLRLTGTFGRLLNPLLRF